MSSDINEDMSEANRGLDLERELTCSICTEVLYAPRTLLDCLHTFCGSCLKEWFSWQLSSWRNVPHSLPSGATPYTCPSCRAPVRDTKHNSTLSTLLEMFLAANPDKCRTAEEQEELKKKYSLGDNLFPKRTRPREHTLQERQVEEADQRLIDEVRQLSLREAGLEAAETVGSSADQASHVSHGTRGRDAIRSARTYEDRNRERRRQRQENSPRNGRELTHSGQTRQRQRDRSLEVLHPNHTAPASQVKDQPSLRSLIGGSEINSQEMEEEILRQIREEGLLDGIDLEKIDSLQEDQITERVAEAFRRWQSDRVRRKSKTGDVRSPRRGRNVSSPDSFEISGGESPRGTLRRRVNHTRSSSRNSQHGQQSRPPQSISALQAAHLEESSTNECRVRSRLTRSSNRNLTEPMSRIHSPTRPASRSVSDPSDRSISLRSTSTWSVTSGSSRSSVDLMTPQTSEFASGELRARLVRIRSNSSPRSSAVLRQEESASMRDQEALSTIHGPLLPSNLSSNTSFESNLVPAPLFPQRMLLGRANILPSGPTPSSKISKTQSPLFSEPLVNCARCSKRHIEYEWHYNCSICSGGHYNICMTCYRSGNGCLHWLGIGPIAWKRWENLKQSGRTKKGKPHTLTPSRYLPPKASPGGADGRRTLTTENPQKRLESGTFCASCEAWTNECYWRCDVCNDGDWGFCNTCVNQGRSCTHPIIPFTYKPPDDKAVETMASAHQKRPTSASILTGPGVMEMGPFKPLTFSSRCDICRYPIQPSQTRFHCYTCSSSLTSGAKSGDYEVCTTCYPKLVWSQRISNENGPCGWRRCLRGHRMVIIGFDDKHGGQRRLLVKDQIGGRCLKQKPCTTPDFAGLELECWSWGSGSHVRGDDAHVKLVTTDVKQDPPASAHALGLDAAFPPAGGVGMRVVANWGWFPTADAADELLFPRGAEIREVKDVNGDWFHGSYMGRAGLFPSSYVRILDRSAAV